MERQATVRSPFHSHKAATGFCRASPARPIANLPLGLVQDGALTSPGEGAGVMSILL